LSNSRDNNNIDRYCQFEDDFRISFQDKGLLELALSHSSYVAENLGRSLGSNERLEFLGDAVVGLIIAHELYCRYPNWSEGELTEARKSLVNRKSLASLATDLDIGKYLCLGIGEEASGGRGRESNLGSAYEALVGAIHIDGGYQAAKSFVLGSFEYKLSGLGLNPVTKDPKSLLQQIAQSKRLLGPVYKTVKISGKDHVRIFTVEVNLDGRVLGVGIGNSKKEAENKAAYEALKLI